MQYSSQDRTQHKPASLLDICRLVLFRGYLINRNEHRLVILVSQLIHHNQNLTELRKNVEIVSIHQVRIHQCLSPGKKWLRDATLFVHRIEAENTAKIG